MLRFADLVRWFPGFASRDTRERELDEEIRFHLEMEAATLEHRGCSPESARREARRAFGSVERAKEEVREARGGEAVYRLGRDLWLAVRRLAASPAYAITVLASLAAAIGGAVVVYAVVEGVLWRPLGLPEEDQIVTIWETDKTRGDELLEVSPGNFYDWRERATAFSALGLVEPYGYDLTAVTPPVPLSAWNVTPGLFAALGLDPILGRPITTEDTTPGAEPVVVVSYEVWQSQLDGAPEIVDSTIEIDGGPVRVVGVLPARLDYPPARDVWGPLVLDAGTRESRSGRWMLAVGRIRPELDPASAQADLDRVASILASEHPETNRYLGIRLVPLRDHLFGPLEGPLSAALAAVVLLLLVAGTNVAGVGLARGLARQRETAIRAALGATPLRLVWQGAAETLVLVAVGGALGLALGRSAIPRVVALVPPGLHRLVDSAHLSPIGNFTAATTAIVALVAAVLPAVHLTWRELHPLLADARTGASPSSTLGRAIDLLAICQIAFALLLVGCSALMAWSVRRALAIDLGVTVEDRVGVQLHLFDLHPDPRERVAFTRHLVDRIEQLPGIRRAAATSRAPLHDGIEAQDDFQIVGRPDPTGREGRIANTIASDPAAFELLGIELVEGRAFVPGDDSTTAAVAVINETMARRFWGADSPIGERLVIGYMGPPREREIVGVVADVRSNGYGEEPRPEVFLPLAQTGSGHVTLMVESEVGPAQTIEAIEALLFELTPGQSIADAFAFDELAEEALAPPRLVLALLSVFAALALALSGLGVYALVSLRAVNRTREMGVRMAVGARPIGILWLGLRHALGLWAIGVTLGLAGTVAVGRTLRALLFATRPTDPAALLSGVAILLVVVLAAAFVPAWRAARRPPVDALRWE